jgi:hypothetical protein
MSGKNTIGMGQSRILNEKAIMDMNEHVDSHRHFTQEQLLVLTEDLGMPGSQLDDKYNPEGDGEHPVFVRETWRREVSDENTISGYWDWAAHQIALSMAKDYDGQALGRHPDLSRGKNVQIEIHKVTQPGHILTGD